MQKEANEAAVLIPSLGPRCIWLVALIFLAAFLIFLGAAGWVAREIILKSITP